MSRKLPGINIQWPWSQLILAGKKTVETRGYPIPQKYIGKQLAIIETPGPNGKRDGGVEVARIVGVVTFSKCYEYQDEASWLMDKDVHLVPPGHKIYGYKQNKTKWGWLVEQVMPVNPTIEPPNKRGIVFCNNCEIP